MKIDKKLLVLICVPFIAVLLCILAYMIIPDEKNYTPDRPEFLTYVDQLGLYSQNFIEKNSYDLIKDVFHRDTVDQDPIKVSMIVKNNAVEYGIINGNKMRIGDKTDCFTLLEINKDSVTVAYHNGAKETVHVKIY
jgi:hypothetical protein